MVYTIKLKRWRSDEIAFYFYNEYRRKTCFNARNEYANKCKWPEWLLKEIFVHQGGNSRHRQAISYHKYNSRMNKTWLWSAYSMVTAQGLVLSSLYHTMDHTIYVLFRGRGLRDLKIRMANQYNKCHKIQDVCQTQHVSFFLM